MKHNKYISIDEEFFYKLKEESNASDLINELLKAYYDGKNCENREILRKYLLKIKQILKENRKKQREIEDNIAKIDAKEQKINLFLKEKQLTRAKLIKQIELRREKEKQQGRRITYYDTAEEEAARILKGGTLK